MKNIRQNGGKGRRQKCGRTERRERNESARDHYSAAYSSGGNNNKSAHCSHWVCTATVISAPRCTRTLPAPPPLPPTPAQEAAAAAPCATSGNSSTGAGNCARSARVTTGGDETSKLKQRFFRRRKRSVDSAQHAGRGTAVFRLGPAKMPINANEQNIEMKSNQFKGRFEIYLLLRLWPTSSALFQLLTAL